MADSLLSHLPEQGISPLPEQGIEEAEASERNAWRQPSPLPEHGIEKAEPKKETEWRLNFNQIQRPERNEWPKHCLNVAETGIEEAEPSNQPSPLLEHGVEKAMPSEENAWRLNFNRFPRPERKETPKRCLIVSGPCSGDGVAKYYQQQGEMLDGFAEMDLVTDNCALPGMSKEDSDKLARSETIAIHLSNIANIVLFIAKVYASIKSGSLAIIASTLDSLLDLLSGFILWFTAFKMKSENPYRYPIGKKRMQPLGIMVFASVMATLGLAILLESIRQLVSKEHNLSLEGGGWHWVVGIMVSVTIVKLVLVIYCRSFTNEIVRTYAQDHFFDVVTNAIGLVAAILASKLYWWIDPVGAIVECIHSIQRKKLEALVMKIDLQQAYDCVDWTFLRLVLQKIGLSIQIIEWIMVCVSNTWLAVLINGFPTEIFRVCRGLRQGCSLSLLLFILIMDGIGQKIQMAKSSGIFRGIQICPEVCVTHPFFVDDILTFAMLLLL